MFGFRLTSLFLLVHCGVRLGTGTHRSAWQTFGYFIYQVYLQAGFPSWSPANTVKVWQQMMQII